METARFDPSTLDWSKHNLGPDAAELGDGVFLADVAQSLGAAIFEGWWGDETACLAPPNFHGLKIEDPAHAFEPKIAIVGEDPANPAPQPDVPIKAVHDAFGATVRSVLSPAAWRDIELRIEDYPAWLQSHVPDPAGGQPLSQHALAARQGDDTEDPISEANWQAAWEMVEIERATHEAAKIRIARVAKAVADLVLADRLQLSARPVTGGASDVEVPKSIWFGGVETRLRRLAACGFDPTRPDDALATPTHLIFAESNGLKETIAEYGAPNLVSLVPPHELWTTVEIDDGSDDDGPQVAGGRPKGYADLERRAEEFLRPILSRNDTTYWRENDLLILAEAGLGKNWDDIVRIVRRRLVAEPEFSHMRKPGQPASVDRPSNMSPAAVRKLISSVSPIRPASS